MKQYNDPKGQAGSKKAPLGLVPPYAMEQTAWVHKLGAEKYGPWNWRETGVCATTYVNAILRHLNAWRDGEDLDPESGITHLAHIACSANILMDAEYCGKLQDDRNKRPTSGEVEEDSPINGMTDEEFDRIIASLRGDLEDFGFEITELDEDADCDLKEEPSIKYRVETTTYRKLEEGEKLQDGDEVYVGEDHWLPVYISDWVTPSIVNRGTYRRKVITDCDLKEEPQDMGECTCGRRLIYHWLYGWICEDCELKHHDSYYP
jgi:hypothetical protein